MLAEYPPLSASFFFLFNSIATSSRGTKGRYRGLGGMRLTREGGGRTVCAEIELKSEIPT
jgi:hypothetical protein